MLNPCGCLSVLRLQPNDADAMQTKLFLLLQTEQYDTALSLIGSGNGHDFESTYSLYRLQREADAEAGLKTLKATHDGQDEDSQEARGVLHLEAQLVCPVSFYEYPYSAADHRTI